MGGIHILGKAFISALCLAYLNFANSNPSSRNKATVDVHWVCYMPACVIPVRLHPDGFHEQTIYISAWASALSVLRWRAMRRPRYAGRQRYRLPRFFVYMPNTFQSRPFRPGEFAGNNEKLIWKSLSKTGSIRSLANALRVGCKKLKVVKLTQQGLPWTALSPPTSPMQHGYRFSN